MGAYGIRTTCGICKDNHPTRSDAVACANVFWKRQGYAGFQERCDDYDPAPVHTPTPAITFDEMIDLWDTRDSWDSAFIAVCARALADSAEQKGHNNAR